jgi:hypothetical protein
MWNDQYTEAYRISRGIDKPITRERVHQIARILSYSQDPPSEYIPDDIILVMSGNMRTDPLEARVDLAIGWAICAGFIKEDLTNPKILIPVPSAQH